MSVLCYVRPWSEAQFEVICSNAFPNSEIHYISDFPGHSSHLQEKIVDGYRKARINEAMDLDDDIVKDITMRCRLLRKLPKERSRKLIYSCTSVISSLFSQFSPEYVIGICVDSYVTDLLRYHAERRGIRYLGLAPVFINGFCRLTARGEYIKTRTVDDNEVDEVYEKIAVRKERPIFIEPYLSNIQFSSNSIKSIVRNKLRHLKLKAKRALFSDYRYCYHYWSTDLNFNGCYNVDKNIFTHSITEHCEESSCYIPLQFIPECTVDYWVKDINYIDYYPKLFNLVEWLSSIGIRAFIKEHPASLGKRPDKFYNRLLSYDNVTLLSPRIDSDSIISFCDFTLVWTGSSGAEAYIAGKPVVHLGDPYYSEHFDGFIKYREGENLISMIKNAKNGDARVFVKHLLEGTVPAPFYHDYETRDKRQAVQEMMLLGAEINKYINLNKSK